LQERLGVRLSNPELLVLALTHRSYLGETTVHESNERLEFLGDSVIGLVVAEHLFTAREDWTEGDLSRAKAVAVSQPTLADAARGLELQDVMRLSTGERQSGGFNRSSILSDMFEALVGVIHVDQGFQEARSFVLRTLAGVLDSLTSGEHAQDHKSLLQQLVQSRSRTTPHYTVLEETGADHDKTFTIQVLVEGRVLGRGVGKSKKQAEQMAAHEALHALGSSFAGPETGPEEPDDDPSV
jgi:ribonuclease-3